MSRNGSNYQLEREDNKEELYPVAEKTGYTFVDWKDEKGQSLSVDTLAHEKTFYASYVDEIAPTMRIEISNNIAASQTVSFYAEDLGSGVAGFYAGTQNPLNTPVPFQAANGIPVTEEGNIYCAVVDGEGNMVTEEVTFYLFTLQLNGGSLATDKILLAEGATITLPTPSKSGYSGTWIDDATGAVVKTATADSSKSYSVQWKANQPSSNFCGIAVHGGTDSNGNIISVCNGCGKRMDAIGQYHIIN